MSKDALDFIKKLKEKESEWDFGISFSLIKDKIQQEINNNQEDKDYIYFLEKIKSMFNQSYAIDSDNPGYDSEIYKEIKAIYKEILK